MSVASRFHSMTTAHCGAPADDQETGHVWEVAVYIVCVFIYFVCVFIHLLGKSQRSRTGTQGVDALCVHFSWRDLISFIYFQNCSDVTDGCR